MGYEVHITRKNEWFAEDGPATTLDEWLEYVSTDPEMRADGYAEARTSDDSILRVEDPGIAVWTAYSRHGADGNMAWFSHFTDHVSVKHPDEEILAKMYQIALALGAKVQGDEGEEYDGTGRSNQRGGEEQPMANRPESPWWKFWK